MLAGVPAVDWLPILISSVALLLSVLGLIRDELHHRQSKREQARLASEVDRAVVLSRVRKLVDKWRNSILSDQYAVRDDNWSGLLARATEWRTALADEREDMLRHSRGERTRAYLLLGETVEPAKEFETTLRPIVAKWNPAPQGADPYEDKMLVQAAITRLQDRFQQVMEELENLSDAEILDPVKSNAAEMGAR
jgi:hypothetical protein